MKRFNSAMQGIFFVVGFVGFIGICSVNENVDTWMQTLCICFSIFIIGFLGSLFFDDPARFVKYLVGILVVSCAYIYNFFHQIVEIFKMFYNYKKRCGTYKNTYNRACSEYYVKNSNCKNTRGVHNVRKIK